MARLTNGLPKRDEVSKVILAVSSVSSLMVLIMEGEHMVFRYSNGETEGENRCGPRSSLGIGINPRGELQCLRKDEAVDPTEDTVNGL